MRKILYASACTLALAASWTGAKAQTQSTNNGTGVEEVVVTAERRSVNLQQAPLSATVVSGADLENKGVLTVDQLQFIAPSVTVLPSRSKRNLSAATRPTKYVRNAFLSLKSFSVRNAQRCVNRGASLNTYSVRYHIGGRLSAKR